MHGLQLVDPLPSWYVPASHLSQIPLSPTAVKVPGSHGVCASEPVGQNVPGSHGRQSPRLLIASSDGLLRRPAGHESAADAPEGQYWPGVVTCVHALHAVSPSSSWKLPALHGRHSLAAVSLLNVPGAQGVSASEPVGQKLPAPQTMQSSTLVITISEVLVRRPAGHGSGAEDPSAQ